MKRLLIPVLAACLLFACQPTPDHEAIVPPNGYEAAILDHSAQAEQTEPIRPSVHWTDVIHLKYWDVNIDADVFPNVSGTVPVYESRWVTMDEIPEQAEKVKRGLLKNATSVCEDGVMTKSDWYQQVKLYADSALWDDETGGRTRYPSDAEVKSYMEDLKPFIDEAPDELTFRPFSPESDPIPDDAGYRLSDGTKAWMHCQSKSIFILYGEELFYNAFEQPESFVLAGDAVSGEPRGTQIEGVTVDQTTAEEQAKALLSELSLEGFRIAESEKARYINEYTLKNVTVGYRVVFCRAEGAYEAAYNTVRQRVHTEGPSFRPDWPQEQIFVFVDGNGVRSFFWTNPTAKPQPVNEAVGILSFEDVQDVIFKHMKNMYTYEEDNELFREWYEGRAKYMIDHVGLYMEMLPKKNNLESFYYGPVWIVTVRNYPADAGDPDVPDMTDAHYLHINAIDGSLVGY